jgi:hypothetical protein
VVFRLLKPSSTRIGLQITETLFNEDITVNRIIHLNWRSKNLEPDDVAFREKCDVLALSFQEK